MSVPYVKSPVLSRIVVNAARQAEKDQQRDCALNLPSGGKYQPAQSKLPQEILRQMPEGEDGRMNHPGNSIMQQESANSQDDSKPIPVFFAERTNPRNASQKSQKQKDLKQDLHETCALPPNGRLVARMRLSSNRIALPTNDSVAEKNVSSISMVGTTIFIMVPKMERSTWAESLLHAKRAKLKPESAKRRLAPPARLS